MDLNIPSKNLILIGTSLGILSFAYSIRSHFLRLASKNRKQIGFSEKKKEEVVEEKKEVSVISEELLEKMVEKIKNNTIHNIAIFLDSLNESKGFEQTKREGKLKEAVKKEEGDDIKIEDDTEENKVNEEEKGKEELSEEKREEIVENICQLSMRRAFLQDFESELFEYHSITNKIHDSYQILTHLCNLEKEIIKSFKFTVTDYKKYLQKYMSTNKKIKSYVNILNLYMQSLDNKQLFSVDFSDSLSSNYLKIVSNIYHLNLTRTLRRYIKNDKVDDLIEKAKHGNPSARSSLTMIFNEIYKEELDKTREDVSLFFNVKKHSLFEIPVKTLLRIYPYYHSKESEMRKKYINLTGTVNGLIQKLEMKEGVEEFIDEKHEKYVDYPVDDMFSFGFEEKEKEEKEENEEKEKEKKKKDVMEKKKKDVVNKYLEKYGNKENEDNVD